MCIKQRERGRERQLKGAGYCRIYYVQEFENGWHGISLFDGRPKRYRNVRLEMVSLLSIRSLRVGSWLCSGIVITGPFLLF